jgi:hypothetical protein
MIFRSCGVVWSFTTPLGRQRETGSSFPFWSIRARLASAAHG